MAAREEGGAFKSLFDFCERVSRQHINRRTIEALVRGGAFDSIEPNRARLLANIDLAMSNAEQQEENANQGGLFDMVEDAIAPLEMIDVPAWGEAELLAEEKQAIGFYFSGHPFGPAEKEVRQFAPTRLSQLKPNDNVRVAGFATAIRSMVGKRGKIAFITLEDTGGKAEVMVSGETLEQLGRDTLRADQVLIAECRISRDDYGGEDGLRIIANRVYTLQEARSHYARALTLHLAPHHDIPRLAELLQRGGDGKRVPLRLHYANDKAGGELIPDSRWQPCLTTELLEELVSLLGERQVGVNW